MAGTKPQQGYPKRQRLLSPQKAEEPEIIQAINHQLKTINPHTAAAPFFFCPIVNKPCGRSIMRPMMSSE